MNNPPPTPLTKSQKEERLRLQRIAGAEATADYVSAAAEVEAKTLRLRAQRLERDRKNAAEQVKVAPKRR